MYIRHLQAYDHGPPRGLAMTAKILWNMDNWICFSEC